MTHLNRLGQLIIDQATGTERSTICVSQQYCLHNMIEAEWGYLQWKNHLVIFLFVLIYFLLNLDETSFLCNEYYLMIIGGNYKPRHDKSFSDYRF